MKKFISVQLLVLALICNSTAAQTKQSALNPLLRSYYQIKDALVNSNAAAAALHAKEFLKAMNGISSKNLSPEELNIYLPVNDQLLLGAKDISENTSLEKQREQFSSFSSGIYTLAKNLKLTNQPVYYAYCPMKKTSWLSNEKAIKNPYYGKNMLTCGKVTEVINAAGN